MLLTLRWLLAGLLAAVLLRFRFRRFPVFCLYVAIALIALVTHIRLEQWLGQSWLTGQRILTGARAAVTLEILWLAGKGLRRRERLALTGFAACTGAALAEAGWVAVLGSFYYGYAGIMRSAEAGMLLAIAAVFLLTWRVHLPVEPAVRRHAALWALLMGNQIWTTLTRPETGVAWRIENAAYLLVACACAVGWLRATMRFSSEI